MKRVVIISFTLAASSTWLGCPQPTPAAVDAGAAVPDVGPAQPGVPNPHEGGGAHGAMAISKIGALADDATILVVDGVKYTKKQLNQAITQSALAAGIPPAMVDAQAKQAFEKPAYEKLIERQLLAAEAKKRGLYPTLEEAEQATAADRERLVATLPPGKTFADALQQLGTDEATFKAELQTDVAVGRLLKSVDESVPQPDEAGLKKFYDENQERMQVPDTASASHILIKLAKDAPADEVKKALEKAKAIRAEVKGKDKDGFAKVATAKSEDASAAQTGGDLGTFKKGDLLPELEAVAFKLKDGEISEPVRSDRGFHILRGQGTKKGHLRTFDEVKSAISQRERAKVLMQKVDDLIEGLRKSAKIERVVEPSASPFSDEDAHGSQVPAWRPGEDNAAPGMMNPHGNIKELKKKPVDVPKDGSAG